MGQEKLRLAIHYLLKALIELYSVYYTPSNRSSDSMKTACCNQKVTDARASPSVSFRVRVLFMKT